MENNFVENEHKTLKFWEEKKIFEKLKEKNKNGKPLRRAQGKVWSFLDGPITANNPMGVHHAWGRTYKDLFQRYKAMQGYEERFQNGFDCQGLWVEVEVEKELGFKNKKDIEKYGIAEFVEKCKERVRKYSQIQTEQSIRLGQWADWEHSYYTMSNENNYAIWHFLKRCHEKGLLYKGHDVVPWCPRCGTAISQHEILTEEYQEITHKAIYFKLPVEGENETYFLAWTTTPWTLPSNVFLSVSPDLLYAKVADPKTGEFYILLKEKASLIEGGQIVETFSGRTLENKKYIGMFDDLSAVREALAGYEHKVVVWKDVTAEEGTGIVHSAPGCGQEDFQLGKQMNLPVIDPTNDESKYKEGFSELTDHFVGEEFVKNWIFENLSQKGLVFKVEDFKHRYPTCWRCKSELVFRLVDEWYISMDYLKGPLMNISRKINWIPDFCLDRELDWLKNMRDWLISKKRYWGLALPIWECECGNFEVIGSREELQKRAIDPIRNEVSNGVDPIRGDASNGAGGWEEFEGKSPHRPWIDKIKIRCSKCNKVISRILDVGSPWLDAGIVPFSTISDDNRAENIPYFHNKKEWQKWFPADLVCESFPGQFKNWFYVLLAMSQVLENEAPFKNLLGYAMVVDEKGEEMHKSKGNAIWFDEAVEKIGADVMRWMYAVANPANNLRFGFNVARETERKILTLTNCVKFFETYVDSSKFKAFDPSSGRGFQSLKLQLKVQNLLDKWILSRLNNVIKETTENLEKFDSMKASQAIEDFWINDLSLWYVRRSRKRFQSPESEGDKQQAEQTFYYVLLTIAKLIAPFMPFLAEQIYQELCGGQPSAKMKEGSPPQDYPESVHLCQWPEVEKKFIDEKLEKEMQEARDIVSLVLAKRAEVAIGVRQALQKLKIQSAKFKVKKEFLELIKDEVNVKEIVFNKKIKEDIELDTTITDELKEEGIVREIIRRIQDLRKKAGLTPSDTNIIISYSASEKTAEIFARNKDIILSATRSKELKENKAKTGEFLASQDCEINSQAVWLALEKS